MSIKRFFNFVDFSIVRVLSDSPNFLYNTSRRIRCVYDWIKIKVMNFRNISPVIVYQQGRVGSTSVYESLYEILPNEIIYHVHTIKESHANEQIKRLRATNGKIYRNLYVGKYLSRIVQKPDFNPVNKWKIISIYRDPIEIILSLTILHLGNEISLNEFMDENGEIDKNKAVKHFCEKIIFDDPSGWAVCNWFDDVFNEELGINIYNHEINKNNYTIITENNFQIMLLPFENLRQSYISGCNALFNLDSNKIELKFSNVHQNRKYSELHKYLKNNIVLPEEFCRKVYSTKFIKHFYSDEMISDFIKKWGSVRG